jgi:hypothetical protein
MRRVLPFLWICALLFASGAARATPVFTLSGGVSATDPGNDFLWIDSPVIEGATLSLSEPGILTIEYIGKEAGFPSTEFWFGSARSSGGGTLVATTNSGNPLIEGQTAALPFPPPGIVRGLAPYTVNAAAGVVPFYFRSVVVANGSPPGPGGLAFWWPGGTSAPGNVIYVLLDDGGGFNPSDPSDNDHDDMIMRFTVAPIPEPATSAMLLLGLGALAVVPGRRRSR